MRRFLYRRTVGARDGSLNSALEQMPDLRVGDLVLFRWNFATTFWRLIQSYRFVHLCFTAVPAMAKSWLNRYGTFSYWSHVALVYAAPSEPAEAEAYKDPLFLEAEPDTGVAIHGPKQYFEHPGEWDIAVLRPKATWLNDWPTRRLLRRLALGSLQAHYDNRAVVRGTLLYAARLMESRGRALVGGMVKGALAGLAFNMVWIAILFLAYALDQHDQHRTLLQMLYAAAAWLTATWDSVLQRYDQSGLIPFQWGPLLYLLNASDLSLRFFGWFFSACLLGFGAVLGIGIAKVVVTIWAVTAAFWGAVWGAAVAPFMAELADGWTILPNVTRWLITIPWVLIPLVVILVAAGLGVVGDVIYPAPSTPAAAALAETTSPAADQLYRQSKIFEELGLVLLLYVLGTVWLFLPALIWTSKTWGSSSAGPQPHAISPHTSVLEIREPQFICSSFVYDALLRTADTISPKARFDVQLHDDTQWHLTLPRHFAESDKFDWIYLLMGGVMLGPSAARARVNQEDDPQHALPLVRNAARAFRYGVLGLTLVVGADVIRWDPDPLLFGLTGNKWSVIQLGLATLASVWTIKEARTAGTILHREPARRGRLLRFAGMGMAAATLAAGVLVLAALASGTHFTLINLWWVLVLIGVLAGRIF